MAGHRQGKARHGERGPDKAQRATRPCVTKGRRGARATNPTGSPHALVALRASGKTSRTKDQGNVRELRLRTAFLLAAGFTYGHISSVLGVPVSRVNRWASRSDVLAERNRFHAELGRSMVGDFATVMAREFNPSLQRLKTLRDQDSDLRVALGATNSFLDRIVPKRTEERRDETLTIQFDPDALGRAKSVRNELTAHRSSDSTFRTKASELTIDEELEMAATKEAV